MKNFRYIAYILAGIMLLGINSCEQFENVSGVGEVKPVTATVKVTLDLEDDMPTPGEMTVRLVNFAERYELSTTMAAGGNVTVDDIIPGIYTVTVSAEHHQDGFTYNYNGSAVNVDIIGDGTEINVQVGGSKSGALLFKEVYYSGSRTPSGGSYFRDQFYEIYNNSETVQNIRGLCIAIIAPLTATANMPVWEGPDADNYVYALNIWQVPDDRDYPLEPGEAFIIAQMADDHRKANLNPAAPVSLLSAEFETLVNTTSLIQDNPAINMHMAFWPRPTPQWLTSVFGAAFILFYPSEPIDPNSMTEVVTPLNSTTQHYRVPIKDVVDALETVNNSNLMQLKRMPAILDAGATTVEGTYVAKSVARKVKETLPDGRIILMDTNNSTEDFEVMDTPEIRRYGVKIPSWNTWR